MRSARRRRRREGSDERDQWASTEVSSLTQRQLAKRLGCSQSYVSKYEAGILTLSVPQVDEIVTELGSSLSAFVRLYEVDRVGTR
jgi:transcriptional regulator with XRE-family HTH domain